MNRRSDRKPHTNRWNFAVYIGFFAGLIWGGVQMIANYFHFTSLSPGFLLEPYYKHSYLMTWRGYMLGWLAFIALSVVAALLYTMLFAKAFGPWYGIGYGVAWWAFLFLLVGPVTGMMNWIAYLDLNTVVTQACLFVVWGLFIGYSISFEFTNEREREPFATSRDEPEPT
ncbi:hypothetical protein AV654_11120 [Paenibacillus elgii]|uniref:Uncharacterized protein n=1 Tax=Paenibacillus elgii TaxID=189691 RepID=A0A165RD37_9BACL|nr:YqhR family membrane protein [Paenibacillus elgii]KZE80892.1 hypothetical protein AV654_11120 [Paenibacillus elgii]